LEREEADRSGGVKKEIFGGNPELSPIHQISMYTHSPTHLESPN